MLTRRDALTLPLAGLTATVLRSPFVFALDTPDPTRVFTDGKKPTDVRLGRPRNLREDYFPLVVPKTKEEWERRRQQVREQVLVANGLWPMPEKTPLNAVVHGKIERDGYTIEKVSFASMPGHYVTGNLYRPIAAAPAGGKRAAVLFAHGHWANGRFHDAGEKAAEASVKAGGEPDADRGRYFMQALPATLAKLGFVVFQYDMVGYADSTAIKHTEGFKDAEAELRLQSFMGLQTWNSIRALDFLSGLPDVDAKRIGMTGASGGGTQTFILAGIDDRLAAAFPAVMVSTAMQGGCVCENCSLLRVNTGNIELAALFAPKPLAMSAANDWTKDLMTKGYPELKELYTLLGAEDKVAARAWLEYGHQYNRHAREFMYAWFRRHLQGMDEKAAAVTEPPLKPVPPAELSVFDAAHPRPKDELPADKLREVITKASDEQMAKLFPKDAATLKEFKRVVGTALRVMVNTDISPNGFSFASWTRSLPKTWPGKGVANRVVIGRVRTGQDAFHAHRIEKFTSHSGPGMHSRPAAADHWFGDAIPLVWCRGGRTDRCVVWLHPKGKASLYENGKLHPAAEAILDNNLGIVAIDLLGTGEQVGDKTNSVDKSYAGYTYGYNRSLLADHVLDTLTAISFARQTILPNTTVYGGTEEKGLPVHIVGWGAMGPVAVLAKALAGDKVAKLAADMNQFRFENIKDAADPMMLPGAVKYGGMSAFLALCAPGEVLAHNHAGTASGKLSKAAYEVAGAADKLIRVNEKMDDMKVVEWLIR